MPRRFIDLSVPLEADIQSDPEIMLPKIQYFKHQDTAEQVMSFFPGLTKDQLPGGEGWALEAVHIFTHNGTHLDAPYHHHSTMNGGERAITILSAGNLATTQSVVSLLDERSKTHAERSPEDADDRAGYSEMGKALQREIGRASCRERVCQYV